MKSRQTNTNTCLTLIIISNYQHAILCDQLQEMNSNNWTINIFLKWMNILISHYFFSVFLNICERQKCYSMLSNVLPFQEVHPYFYDSFISFLCMFTLRKYVWYVVQWEILDLNYPQLHTLFTDHLAQLLIESQLNSLQICLCVCMANIKLVTIWYNLILNVAYCRNIFHRMKIIQNVSPDSS